MKKFAVIILLAFGISFAAVAQNSVSTSAGTSAGNSAGTSAGTANKNTALRCLKLAENCLVADDWQNALNQAELGLSYDDSISDLYYIKAAAQLQLGGTKADALRTISISFQKNNWAGYSKNGARIFIADLLSDTGLYEESLAVLDTEPFIYSADAEFIRIKNYYRLGTKDSLNNARLKVNSVRRVYPSDSRFPEIFFMFESIFLDEAGRNGVDYKIPQIVQNIADSYISKLPDYAGKNPETELLAANFARGDEKLRLIKAIDAKKSDINPLLAIAGLKAGIYSQTEAFEMFFDSTENIVSLDMLETFISLLDETEGYALAAEKLGDFNGTIYIDENMDLQYEFTVTYEKGRPQYIKYDGNNDGEIELYASCDFGSPAFVYFNTVRTQVFYDVFPKVQRVFFSDSNLTMNFFNNDLSFSPFDFVTDNIFARTGVEFFVPFISSDVAVPLPQELIKTANSFELPIAERDNARIVYTISGGQLVFAEFFEQNKKYAHCDLSSEVIVRQVDYDNDGYYETTEYYAEIPETAPESAYDDSKALVSKIFSFLGEQPELYLRKVQIDDNANTFCEFAEEYLEYNGKITTWDNDDNGLPDCQYIRYPKAPGDSLIEETIYFDSNGLKKLSLSIADGVPLKMKDGDSEVMVYSGEHEFLYWIDFKGSFEMEAAVMEYCSNGIEQGRIDIVEYKNERISVIKVGAYYFCRYIPATELNLEEPGDEE